MNTCVLNKISTKYSYTVHASQESLYDKNKDLLYFLEMENEEFLKEIAAYIKKARLHLDMTQEQLALEFNCTKSNVSGWENGRHEAPYRVLYWLVKKTGIALPHDKSAEILESIGLPDKELDVSDAEIIRTALDVPEESRDQVKKILTTFSKDERKKK